jgi:hypothetical protein
MHRCVYTPKADAPLSNLARFVPLFCVEVGVASRDLVDLPSQSACSTALQCSIREAHPDASIPPFGAAAVAVVATSPWREAARAALEELALALMAAMAWRTVS